jgi:hypothetical protein
MWVNVCWWMKNKIREEILNLLFILSLISLHNDDYGVGGVYNEDEFDDDFSFSLELYKLKYHHSTCLINLANDFFSLFLNFFFSLILIGL